MIITAGLLGGGIAAGITKMAFKRMHIPLAEIYMKKGPVAWIKIGHEKFPFSIKPRNGYFVLHNNRVKGIFKLDHKSMYLMGKTPCWDYNYKNMNPIDDVLCEELHKFADTNGLTKIKRSHVKQSQRLRTWYKRKQNLDEAMQELEKDHSKAFMAMETGIRSSIDEINESVQKENEGLQQGEVEKKPTKHQYSLLLIDHLLSKGLLDEQEHRTFLYKLENGQLEFQQLITELRDANIVSINEPLREDVEMFLDDFGSQDPLQMSGHVDDLRLDRKNLKTMTAVPVKQIIPGAVIIAVFIGGSIALVVVSSNWDQITGGLNLKIPFIMGNFIDSLIYHIPNLLMGLF